MIRIVFPCMPYALNEFEPTFESQARAAEERGLAEWGRALVKDQVKSCTVDGPPIVSNWQELETLRARMVEFRGEVEGGLCFRRVESYTQEHRLFVWRGQVHHRELPEAASELAREVASRFHSPFFTIDLGLREDGVWRVIELGDGQVSDLKEWSAQELLAIF